MITTHGDEVGTQMDDVQVDVTPCLGVLLCVCRRRKRVERRGKGIGRWKEERNRWNLVARKDFIFPSDGRQRMARSKWLKRVT